MKCTDCNKEIRPVVAIDIDGTMGMYHRHFLDFASGYLNQQVKDHYIGNQPFKEWFCITYRCTVDDWHDIKLAYRQGGMKRTMPVFPEARLLCENIRAQGVELWVTTTRPYIRHDNVDPDTREWLRRNQIPYDYLIYDGEKYRKLAHLVGHERVVAVLDDLLEECEDAGALFGIDNVILRKSPYNRAFKWQPQATNLAMAERIIRDRIRRWREIYEPEPVRRDDGDHPAGISQAAQGEVN